MSLDDRDRVVPTHDSYGSCSAYYPIYDAMFMA